MCDNSGMTARTSVLFICMGNICRSPLAEGLFRHHADQRGVADRFTIDSAGTGGWHSGEPADGRAREVAARHDVPVTSRARQVTRGDLRRFDHLVCMDEDNRETLLEMGAVEGKLTLLLEHDPTSPIHEVPDPYYGGPEGFETVFRLIDSACAALLDRMLTRGAARS